MLRRAAPHAEEPLGELLQSVVPVLTRLGQYPLHHGTEPRLAPVVPGGRLCTRRITQVGALKQGASCRGIETRIIAVRERKSRRCIPGPRVLIYKGSRHSSV